MNKKFLIILIACLFIGVVVLGLVSKFKNKGTITPTSNSLTIWSPFDEGTTYQKISQEFLDANKITLNFKFVPAKDAADYESKVVDALANGTGPDIWLSRSDWIPKHALKSQSAPQITAKKTTVDATAAYKELIEPSLIDMNTYNGQLYGAPLFADSLVLIVNKKMISDVRNSLPQKQQDSFFSDITTWDQLVSNFKSINSISGDTIQRSAIALGTANNTFAATDVLSAMMVQGGVKITSDDGKDVLFNQTSVTNTQSVYPAKNALTLYTSFGLKGNSNYSWNYSMGDPVEAFLNQKTASFFGYYSTLVDVLDKKPAFDVQVMAMPQLTSIGDPTYYGVTWSHLVNKNAANGSLAWDYLYYLAQSRVQSQYVKLTNRCSIDVVTGKVTQNLVSSDNAANLVTSQFKYAKSLPSPEWKTSDGILGDAVKQIVDYGQSVQTATDNAAESFKNAFK